MPAIIKYHYAQLENGQIVPITEVTRENRAAHYFCVACGDEMEAVLGDKREHHFRHKKAHCSWESYLHKLGKIVIKYRFDNFPNFFVGYYAKYFCDKWQECKLAQQLASKDSCNQERLHSIDLKEYYDTIEEEATYKGFRADLMLSSKEHPERKPVFIEISVTHDCEEKKIDSGIRIIEIKLENEYLLRKPIVEPSNVLQFETKKQQIEFSKTQPIRFYNFKREQPYKIDLSSFHIIPQFDNQILVAHVDKEATSCHDFLNSSNKDDVYSLAVPTYFTKNHSRTFNLCFFGILKGIKSGLTFKHCDICKYIHKCMVPFNQEFVNEKTNEKIIKTEVVPANKLTAIDKYFKPYTCGKFSLNEWGVTNALNKLRHIIYVEHKG